ncbi:hypothetical protein BH20ACT24_BH20ACT24_24050 [soil metagenome]
MSPWHAIVVGAVGLILAWMVQPSPAPAWVARITPSGVVTESQFVEGSLPTGINPGAAGNHLVPGVRHEQGYRLAPLPRAVIDSRSRR